MKVAIFSTKSYDRQFFTAANTQHQHQLTFLEPKLDRHTAILAKDATAVCIFVNDEVDKCDSLRVNHGNQSVNNLSKLATIHVAL